MIGFCISIKNRRWQLEQTLALNLVNIGDEHHITIADLGSDDGLEEYLYDCHANAMATGKLLYFKVDTPLQWSSPKAKNLAHRISPADYLFNIDADNFIGVDDLEKIEACRKHNKSSWQYSETLLDGSYGRIGMTRAVFYNISGYNEAFLPMGAQDLDLLRRIGPVTKLGAPQFKAIANSAEEKMTNVKVGGKVVMTYDEMNLFNFKYAKAIRSIYGNRSHVGFSSFRGKLNGRPLDVTGLDTPKDLIMRSPYIRAARNRRASKVATSN